MRTLAILAMLALAATGATAGERTIILSIPGMYCAACPYIVGEAIGAVRGVSAVDARIEDKSATVTFDDVVTGEAAIIAASEAVGYRASITDRGRWQ